MDKALKPTIIFLATAGFIYAVIMAVSMWAAAI